MLTNWSKLMERWDAEDRGPSFRIRAMNWLRHRVREYFWAPSNREIWLLRGQVVDLENRCLRLEQAVQELNPGLNWLPPHPDQKN